MGYVLPLAKQYDCLGCGGQIIENHCKSSFWIFWMLLHVFGDGAYKRPCACVIFPVSTFPVCSFDGLYISFTHSSMFVLLYLFDARHVGGVGWGGVGWGGCSRSLSRH